MATPIKQKRNRKTDRTEIRYHDLFNGMTEGFALNELVCDRNGNPVDYCHIDINPAFERYTGLKRKNVIGILRSKLLPINIFSFKHYCDVVKTGKPAHFESYSPQINKYRQVYAYRTGPNQFATIFTDITRQKKIEEALRESKNHYQNLFDNMSEGFVLNEIICDKYGKPVDYRFLDANRAFEKFSGIKRRDLIGKLRSQIPLEKNPASFKIYNRVALTGQPATFESYYRPLDKYRRVYAYCPSPGQFATIFVDITEHKKIEKALRESEEKFKAIATSTPDNILMQDNNLRYTFVLNPQLGIPRKDMIGKTDYEIMSKKNASRLVKIKNKVLKTGKPVHLTNVCLPSIDGKFQYFDGSYIPRQDASGNVNGVIGYFRNITPRVKMEEALRKSKDRYRGLYEAILGGVTVHNSDGVIIEANDIACEILGLTLLQMRQRSYNDPRWQALHENGSPMDSKDHPSMIALHTGKTVRNKVMGMPHGKTGEYRWLLVNAEPIKDSENKVVSAVTTFVDITERKRSERALERYAYDLEQLNNDLRKFQLAVQNASDLILITDPEGTILFVNNAIEPLLGFKPEYAIGKKTSILGEKMPKDFYRQMWDTIKIAKTNFSGQLTNIRENGEEVIFELHISPILDARGNVVFFVAIERDCTATKEIDRAKTEFISLASHQLRTPLSMISLSAEILLRENSQTISEENRVYLNQILENTARMAELIDLFLNVSRIELGHLQIDPQPSNVTEITQSAIKNILPQVKTKKINFKTNFEAGLPLINIDRKILNIALENLLSNACKYTPSKGRIDFSIQKNNRYVVFRVADTGRGIPKKQTSQIFGKMFRADNTTDVKGLGIGLYITKNTIEQSGGQITVETKLNKGSAFSIILPLQEIKEKKYKPMF